MFFSTSEELRRCFEVSSRSETVEWACQTPLATRMTCQSVTDMKSPCQRLGIPLNQFIQSVLIPKARFNSAKLIDPRIFLSLLWVNSQSTGKCWERETKRKSWPEVKMAGGGGRKGKKLRSKPGVAAKNCSPRAFKESFRTNIGDSENCALDKWGLSMGKPAGTKAKSRAGPGSSTHGCYWKDSWANVGGTWNHNGKGRDGGSTCVY